MNEPLNPLIEKTLTKVVNDVNTRKFIMEILNIERSYSPRKRKREYETVLKKYVERI